MNNKTINPINNKIKSITNTINYYILIYYINRKMKKGTKSPFNYNVANVGAPPFPSSCNR